MSFDTDKCSVFYLDWEKCKHQYNLCGSVVRESTTERDSGIIVDSSMTLFLTRRTIKCKSQNIVMKLYKALVRPKLECCVQVWRPYLKKNIDNIEKIQHKANKMIEECKHLN